MPVIERLAEIIMENMEFINIKEVKDFCDELKIEVVGLYDPDYSEEEDSDTDSDNSIGTPETVKIIDDGSGFLKLK